MPVSSYHYLVAPLIAAVALAVILLICRWVFSTTTRDERTARRLQKLQSRGDYGLLEPIATTRTPADAAMLRAVLSEAGIRCTVTPAEQDRDGDQSQVVLVFHTDASRARSLVSS